MSDLPRPIRLLAVVHRSTVGGTEVCFERVLGALAADPRYKVCAAYPRDGELVGRWDLLADHIPYDAGVLPDSFDFNAYRGWERRRHDARRVFQSDVASFGPDVIVSFTSVLTAPVDVASALGVPAVAYVREVVQPPVVRRWLWRHLADRADRLIAVSTPLAAALQPYAPGRVRVVHDGVPLPDRSHAGEWPPSPPLCAFYGGYDPKKGGETFLRMAAKVAAVLPDARFAVFGVATREQESYRDSMHRLGVDLGLGDGTSGALEFVETREFSPTFGANTVVVVPSVREGLGLVAIDAMSHGVPVVASRTGGLPDVVEDGVTGALAPVGDADAFAAAVLAIMRDPGTAATMGEAARARVEDAFTVERAVDGLRAVIDEVLDRRPE